MYNERWQKIYEESHDITKEEEIKNKIALLVDEPIGRIIVECIKSKYYISINFSDNKSVSFCKFLIEHFNKVIGGEQGLENAYIEFMHKEKTIYRGIAKKGKVEDLYIGFEGGD